MRPASGIPGSGRRQAGGRRRRRRRPRRSCGPPGCGQRLLHRLQWQQTRHHVEPQDRSRPGALCEACRVGRRRRRELLQGRHGAARVRVRRPEGDQPAGHPRQRQGLRRIRPLQRLPGLRALGPGGWRADGRQRLGRRPPDERAGGSRRLRRRTPPGRWHPGSPTAAGQDRRGTARRGVPAGRRRQPDEEQTDAGPRLRGYGPQARQPRHRTACPACSPAPRAGTTTIL